MNANLRYWRAVLRLAEAELDAAASLSDLQIAAHKFMDARRQLARLVEQHVGRAVQRRRRKSQRKL
jgi:hypothetical protein